MLSNSYPEQAFMSRLDMTEQVLNKDEYFWNVTLKIAAKLF